MLPMSWRGIIRSTMVGTRLKSTMRRHVSTRISFTMYYEPESWSKICTPLLLPSLPIPTNAAPQIAKPTKEEAKASKYEEQKRCYQKERTEHFRQLRIRTRSSSLRSVDLRVLREDYFEQQILSFGSLGDIDEFKEKLEPLKFEHVAKNNEKEFEGYYAQFIPHIQENIRFAAGQKILKIKDRLLRYSGTPAKCLLVNKKDAKQERKHKFNFNSVVLTCTTPETSFPKLDHSFSKELIYIRIKNKRGATTSNILGIAKRIYAGGSEDDDDDEGEELFLSSAGVEEKRKFRKYSVTILGHDCKLLEKMFMATCKMEFEWDWVHGLLPASRMSVACFGDHPPDFFKSVFQKRLKAWPDAPKVLKELTCPGTEKMNAQQLNVVQRMSQTRKSGLYFLIGPPGTGKTTTIVSLLQERVRAFPQEKILMTAPSNKAVQVVLRSLLNTAPAKDRSALPAVALAGVLKDVPPELEEVYANKYKDHLIKPFQELLKSNAALVDKQTALKDAHTLLKTRMDRLLAKTGWSEAAAGREVKNLHAFSLKLTTDPSEICSAYSSEKNLRSHLFNVLKVIGSTGCALEDFVLAKANIVFTTMVASGRGKLNKNNFHTVLVDEASQALIPEVFITFKYQPKLMLLIGDPQQLPAYADSEESAQCGYSDSLMLVMTKGAKRPFVEMLTTQYRAHPSICKWTSDQFYGSKLEPHASVLTRASPLSALPETFLLQSLPSAFIDVQASESNFGGGSINNEEEANAVVQTVRYLLKHKVKPEQIGIITFYAAQVQQLRHELERARLPLHRLALSTVDGFQGDEKDFILVSCVRTNPSAGFLRDHRRINVALSRAKHARWVFGNADKLAGSNTVLGGFLGWTADPLKNDTDPPTRVVPASQVLASMVLPHDLNRRTKKEKTQENKD